MKPDIEVRKPRIHIVFSTNIFTYFNMLENLL